MKTLIIIGAVFGGVVGGWACWRIQKLTKDVERLKRNEFYVESKLRNLARHLEETVEPLRIQLAEMASGAAIDPWLIRNGRLYHDISANEAQRHLLPAGRLSDGASVLVLDVRTPKEFAMKRLPGAQLLPIEELESRYQNDIPRTFEKILVYCASGDRSRLACDFLSRQGYRNLYNLEGGLQRWEGPTESQGEPQLIQIGSATKKIPSL